MRSPFRVTAAIEVKKKNRCFLNKRKTELLREIRHSGSILAASKEMNISYQQAWTFIKEMNTLSPLPVVVNKRGGAKGGGAEVTKYGDRLIIKFIETQRKHEEFLQQLSDEFDSCLL